MPKCVECGAECQRADMFGPSDELRCPNCAGRRRKKYVPSPRSTLTPGPAWVTKVMLLLATLAALAHWSTTWGEPFVDDAFPALRVPLQTCDGALTAESDAVWSGQFWRLFTTIFPHANMIHLVFNAFFIWQFGAALETWMGSKRYVLFLLLTGFGSSAGQFLASGPGIGLSGVGFAMFGLLFALRRQRDFAAELMQPQTVQWIAAWFVLCLVLSGTGGFMIGNGAHAAGAMLGWFLGQALLQRNPWPRLATIVVAVTLAVAATTYMPWSGGYALYRAEQSLKADDDEAALRWFRRAFRSRAFFANPQRYTTILRHLIDKKLVEPDLAKEMERWNVLMEEE